MYKAWIIQNLEAPQILNIVTVFLSLHILHGLFNYQFLSYGLDYLEYLRYIYYTLVHNIRRRINTEGKQRSSLGNSFAQGKFGE